METQDARFTFGYLWEYLRSFEAVALRPGSIIWETQRPPISYKRGLGSLLVLNPL